MIKNIDLFKVKLLIFFFSLLPANLSMAQSVACIARGQDAKFILKSINTVPVVLFDQFETCNRPFVFEPDRKNILQGTLSLPPEELGLNASSVLYWVSFRTGSARRIGELPMSATKMHDFIYENITQEGGSLFENQYEITPSKIIRKPISFEFVIDGILCVQDKKNIWNVELSSEKLCGETITATTKEPVCLTHIGTLSKLSSRSACLALEKRWSTQ